MKEENKSVIPEEVQLNKIYYLRKEKVMLDKELVLLYGVKAIRLREQVKRNADRFPEHFMFQLSREETEVLVSQHAVASMKHLGGYLPYVFTEHGILMLANVLRSDRAIKTSIQIIELFVNLRKLSMSYDDLRGEIE